MGRKQGTARYLPPSSHRPALYQRTPMDKMARPHGAPVTPPKPPSSVCKFCISKDAVWAAKPCFHKVFCDACHALAYLIRCPTCGRPISSFHRV